MGNRIALWDNLKFFLVTCVVIGHFVDQFTGLSNIYDSIFLFIYSFHIPLFIFIAGLMFKNKNITAKAIFFISIGFAYKIVWLYTKSGAWKNSSPGFQFLYTKRQIPNIIKV